LRTYLAKIISKNDWITVNPEAIAQTITVLPKSFLNNFSSIFIYSKKADSIVLGIKFKNSHGMNVNGRYEIKITISMPLDLVQFSILIENDKNSINMDRSIINQSLTSLVDTLGSLTKNTQQIQSNHKTGKQRNSHPNKPFCVPQNARLTTERLVNIRDNINVNLYRRWNCNKSHLAIVYLKRTAQFLTTIVYFLRNSLTFRSVYPAIIRCGNFKIIPFISNASIHTFVIIISFASTFSIFIIF